MLPLHRTTAASPALARLAKSPQPLSRFLLRWVILLSTILAFLYFAGPFLLDFIRPASPDFYPYPGVADLPTFPTKEGEGDGIQFGEPPKDRVKPPVEHTPLPGDQQKMWASRRDEVKEAMRHAWNGYRKHAYPADELSATSGRSSNKYNGWGVTLWDSLDTLWIMGLRDEFDEALRDVAKQNFTATKTDHYAPFFETVIRYLGGALSAYGLSKDKTLLDHADELGKLLLPAFRGTPSGLPAYSVHVESGTILPDQGAKTVLFAEATTCQLEFKYLAKITGNKEYYQVAQKSMNYFYRANVTDGLFHDKWFMEDGKPSGNHFTIGATADSGYEYLLKQWLLSGDKDARTQYLRSAKGIINNLIHITPRRGLLYAGDLVNGHLNHRLEHLSCYLPGLLALGSHLLSSSPLPSQTSASTPHDTRPEDTFTESDRKMHLWAAQGLGYTCALSYLETNSGLGPDQMSMGNQGGQGRKWVDVVDEWEKEGGAGKAPGTREPEVERDVGRREYSTVYPFAYLLRPETVETLFYLYKATGDAAWRERGYKIFEAINKHTRTEYGFASVNGIEIEHPTKLDDMPSWFLAETLKYLYLLMDDTDPIPLDKYVFNTEAHPLPVFQWTEEERREFGVDELVVGL